MQPERQQPLDNRTDQFPPVPPAGHYPSGQYPQPPPHGYYAPPAPAAQPEPPRTGRGRKALRWIVGGFVALFVIGSITGPRDDEQATVTEVPAAAAVPAVDAPAAPAAEVTPAPEALAPEASTAPQLAAPEGIGEGTHIVGVDIEPGTYRSSGATPGLFELCLWSTKDGPASNADVIDFGTANTDERQVVEIASDVGAFESSGCEPWQRVE
jgi:hypothetical protein